METHFTRIPVLMMILTLMLAGYLMMIPQPQKTAENELEGVVDDEDHFPNDTWIRRDTRAPTDWPMPMY